MDEKITKLGKKKKK